MDSSSSGPRSRRSYGNEMGLSKRYSSLGWDAVAVLDGRTLEASGVIVEGTFALSSAASSSSALASAMTETGETILLCLRVGDGHLHRHDKGRSCPWEATCPLAAHIRSAYQGAFRCLDRERCVLLGWERTSSKSWESQSRACRCCGPDRALRTLSPAQRFADLLLLRIPTAPRRVC